MPVCSDWIKLYKNLPKVSNHFPGQGQVFPAGNRKFIEVYAAGHRPAKIIFAVPLQRVLPGLPLAIDQGADFLSNDVEYL